MVWKLIGEFTKMDGRTGLEYHNSELRLDLSVGMNPNMIIPEKYFVHIESSRFGVSFNPIQHWFASEHEAQKFANKYMKRNK